jgi:hypothetical protein
MERKEIERGAIATSQTVNRRGFKVATLCLSLIVSLAGASPSVQACAFASQPYFTYTSHPDLPLDKYAAGKLGILQTGYARSYLLAAYRYLEDKPLSASEQQAFVQLWNKRLTAHEDQCDSDTQQWVKARNTVPGVQKYDNNTIFTERPISEDNAWQLYCNCQTDAFITAAATLKQLIDKFGVSSEQVRQWVDGQDQVFKNCGATAYAEKPPAIVIPDALPASADRLLQQERTYQIASANFYARNFKIARGMFEEIAADANSPWQHLAGYLAVRAMLREATLPNDLDKSLLEQAGEKLKALAADPQYSSLSKDIERLQDFVFARVNPQGYLQALLKRPFDAHNIDEITRTIDNLMGESSDYEDQPDHPYSKAPASVKSPDILDWIITFQSTDKNGTEHAISRWKETHSLPWLVAAADHVSTDDSRAPSIMAAAEKITSGPAHWSLFYDVAQFKINAGKDEEARRELDRVINNPPADLPAGSLNALRTLRMSTASTLAEFIRFAVQAPLSICSNGGVQEVPDDMDDIVKNGKVKPVAPEFTPEAGTILDTKLPLELLKSVASSPQLPAPLRNNVAWTSWVRAVLVGDNAQARPLAELSKNLNPAKKKYVDTYLGATTDQDRAFAAAFLMLHFSSAQPYPTAEQLSDDSYGDSSGWWWGANAAFTPGDTQKSKTDEQALDFVSAKQAADARQQLAKLKKVDGAPDYLTKIVLAFAHAHPTDPRVPEALHLAVKCTRYGDKGDHTTALSKQAFQLLHTQYKTSPWTKETPYYY